MWVVKRSVLFTPVANTSEQAAIERRAVAFTTQDLLIAFGSFGMALFALNLYKLTKPANG